MGKVKIIAQYNDSRQYTHDEWEPITPTLEVTEETTVGEILEWTKKRNKSDDTPIRLTVVDELSTKTASPSVEDDDYPF